MGMFYLLTLYCFIRGASVEGSGGRGQGSGLRTGSSSFVLPPVAWSVGSVIACLLGMASKEVMVSAPLTVLLYDRTFCTGSFREACRRRYGLYLALAGTWLLLGWLVISTGGRGGTAGFASHFFTWWSYLLTQPGVITHYLRLSLWPSALCLDYDWPAAQTASEVLYPGLLVVGLLGLTAWALVKRPAWGFLGAWFFMILAPTSSFVPISDAAFEHRMYLSLAAVTTALVVGGALAGRWLVHRGKITRPVSQVIGGCLVTFTAFVLGILTFQRNLDYRSDVSIWEDTLAKAPANTRAHAYYSWALADCGRFDEAIAHYQKTFEIAPHSAAPQRYGHNPGQARATRRGHRPVPQGFGTRPRLR